MSHVGITQFEPCPLKFAHKLSGSILHFEGKISVLFT